MSLQGPQEARLLAAERRAFRIDDEIRRLKRDVISVHQQWWDEDSVIRRRGSTPVLPTNTTFSGFIVGCNTTHIDSATVQLIRQSDSAVLWTGSATAASGYSGAIALSVNTLCTLTATSPSGRLANFSGSRTINAGTSNAITAAQCPPATGYSCLTTTAFPLKQTLNIVDSRFGNFALNWVTSNWQGGPGLPNTYYLLNVGEAFFMDGDASFNNGVLPYARPTASMTGVVFTFRVNSKPAGSPWFIGDTCTVTEV